MKCPACGNRLHRIQPGEWGCDNDECPANTEQQHLDVEWYGSTQKEINEMYRRSGGSADE